MVRILLIKTADTPKKTVGDVVGIFRGEHEFSEDEKLYFDIMDIEGFDFTAFTAHVQGRTWKMDGIYKSNTNKWTTERPEKKFYYIKDGNYYFLEKTPRFWWSFRNMTMQQREVLESATMTQIEKLNVLGTALVQTVDLYPENQTKVPNLVVV